MQRYGLGNIQNQINIYDRLSNAGMNTIRKVKSALNHPEYRKPVRQFTLADVSRITGISRTTIRNKEKLGQLSYEQALIGDKNKKDYTLSDILTIRKACNRGFFNGSVERPAHLKPFTIAMTMFKGGVGKTTHSTHLAAYCAIQGLRTLLVDLDSQASSTLTMGYIPSLDLDDDACIYDALLEDPNVTQDLIRQTHYHGLDLIPAGLSLAAANVNLHQNSLNNNQKLGSPLVRLQSALDTVSDNYDIIILDCPPNHEAVALNALFCADSYILPITPNMLSFGSSNAFLNMLHEISMSRQRAQANTDINRLFRILITNDPQNNESTPITNGLRAIYGDFVLNNTMVRTIALDRALNDLGILYDVTKSNIRGDKQAFTRALTFMDAINSELIATFRSIWELESTSKSTETQQDEQESICA
jgi:chromosome partitioning protein